MSVIRLIMVENDQTFSGRIPSSAISAVLWAIAAGASDTDSFWQTVAQMDPSLHEHFSTNQDDSPLLEGYDDGLLVISWAHQCIESFQAYQPIRYSGTVTRHNGTFSKKILNRSNLLSTQTGTWSIIILKRAGIEQWLTVRAVGPSINRTH